MTDRVAQPEDGELTLADIARLAGVGLGTASRALRDAPNVAPATRKRVLEVAAQHAYVVSPEAARLAGSSTGRVAVVVPHLSRWFFGSMVEGIESVLRESGLDVLLYQVGDLRDRRAFLDKLPARRKVDGLLVVAFPVEDAERERLERLMKVQIVAAGGQQAVYPHVSIDDLRAGRQAVDHLVALGHRRIAMIEAIDIDQPTRPSGRTQAYYDALVEAGLTPDPRLHVTTQWGGENGAQAMDELLSVAARPTAVYAHSDEVALGAIRSIRRAGLRVPDDISVVGIDDHPMASLADLTTVAQDVHQQGVVAARLLVSLLAGSDQPIDTRVTLPTRLVVRRTTSAPSV